MVAPASKVPKFPGKVGMTMAALMPTTVNKAMRKLGSRWKAPWNSTSITSSLPHPSSDKATMAVTRRGVDACNPDDSACCTRGHRPSRGTRKRPAPSTAAYAATARPENTRANVPSLVRSAVTKIRRASASTSAPRSAHAQA